MEKFEVTILGCGSALPTTRHFPTSQIVNVREKLFMIDCGEGTQLQMRKCKMKFPKMGHIFISHTHGDHCLGLIGLISSMSLQGRTAPLHIFAPEDFEPILNNMLDYFCPGIEYKIQFHPIANSKESALIYEDRSVSIYTLPLKHRIACTGFLFKEKPTLPHIRREMIDFYNIPSYEINRIKGGAGWTSPDGTFIPHERLTTPAAPARSYAYCSDTIYMPSLVSQLENVSLLFHEATFLNNEVKRAKETCHTTALQAATLAAQAHVGKLCIGHYSARYTDETELLNEAKTMFNNTILAKEGLTMQISSHK